MVFGFVFVWSAVGYARVWYICLCVGGSILVSLEMGKAGRLFLCVSCGPFGLSGIDGLLKGWNI